MPNSYAVALADAFTAVGTSVTTDVTDLLPIIGSLLALFIGIAVGVRLIRKFARA
jgi:hypothetical protein